jgi:carboxyl-terminal processing protease
MENGNKRKILLINLVIASFIISILLLVVESIGAERPYTKISDGMDMFTQVYQHVLNYYVKEQNPVDLSKNAIQGIMEGLDPYSEFYEKSGLTQLQDNTKGQFGGLGIEISTPGNYPRVMSYPIEGTPADGKLRAGDEIVEIEGESTFKMEVDAVVSRLRGKVNDPVKIKVKRGGAAELIPFTLIRKTIPLLNVRYSGVIDEGVGYIKLVSFNSYASEEMDKALAALDKPEVKGIILDLRSNPGGLLVQAGEVANKFIGKDKLIVFTRDRNGREERLVASSNASYPNKPLVVLVNRASASASEIVAGAIQDHDRGVLVGETTFGKGSVQTIFDDLSNGNGLKITTALYYTPSERSIHKERTLEQIYEEEAQAAEDPAAVDSLDKSQKFLTLNKHRVVYGGGGITPDVIVRDQTVGNIVRQLLTQNTFFEFGALYASKHQDLKPDFEITGAMIGEFKTFIADTTWFKYEIPGKTYLDSFRKSVAIEEYDKDVLAAVDQVERTLNSKREEDFQASLDMIKLLLKREITSAQFGSSQRTLASKEWDVQLQKAVEIVQKPDLYNSILTQGAETGVTF